MKVMNVGNTHYSNSKQQNFGMVLNFTVDAKKLFSPDALNTVISTVAPLRTSKGEELFVNGCTDFFDTMRLKLFAKSDYTDITVNNMFVSKTPPTTGDGTFHIPSANFEDEVIFALREINEFFSRH